MYLRYTNTCYRVLTFNSTDFLFLNTVIHTTDLMIHDFELHELFNSPKNVHLKALLYSENSSKRATKHKSTTPGPIVTDQSSILPFCPNLTKQVR